MLEALADAFAEPVRMLGAVGTVAAVATLVGLWLARVVLGAHI
jgi:hypothetical protein